MSAYEGLNPPPTPRAAGSGEECLLVANMCLIPWEKLWRR